MATKKSLPKVGEGGAGRAPSEPASSNRGTPKSRWWKTQKSTGQDVGFERLSPQWANSATGEMERFRHVPVVGRLPWRWQYIVAALGLVLGVVIMAVLMTRLNAASQAEGERNASELALRQSLSSVEQGLWMARMQPETAGNALLSAVSSGRTAMGGWLAKSPSRASAVSAEWEKTAGLVEEVNKLLPQAINMRKAATQAKPVLAGGISRASSALAGATTDTSSSRAFIMSVALWSSAVDRVLEDGGKWPENISTQRASLNAAVNAFSASPLATDGSAGSNAWRQAGSAWAQAAPLTQAMVANAPAWNRLVDLDKALREQVARTTTAASAASESAAGDKWAVPAMTMAIAWVVICLLLLMVIGWKQQRFQALAALAAHEQIEAGILGMMEDLRVLADGDLTHRARVSETAVGTMADMLNDTMVRLASLVKDIKKHVEKSSAATQNAVDATGALVDSAREDQAAIVQNSKEIAKVVGGIREVETISGHTKAMSDDAMRSAVAGREAVSEAHRYLQEIRAQAEEARNRVDRLAQSSREISGIATLMNEMADNIGVLAMQAALQAARAGEKGQGFRVVADGVGELAKKSGTAARRVSALIETALGDIEGSAGSMRAATKGTDESMRLMDISLETSQFIEEALVKVTEAAAQLSAVLEQQSASAQALDKNANDSLSRVQQSQDRAQAAAEGVMDLFNSSREMANSANRFKV